MTRLHCKTGKAVFLVLLAALTITSVAFGVDPGPVGGEYRADIPYPEFMPMWREGWGWFDENGDRVRYAHDGMPLGGYLFACFRNGGSQPLQVTDVWLEGVSLAEGVAPEHKPTGKEADKYPANLAFSKLPKDQLDKLVSAGEPVWWKVEPMAVPAGGFGQVTVRLRRDPKVQTLTVTIPSLSEADGKIVTPVAKKQARFFSINFTPTFDAAYAYLRHPSGKGIAPTQILIDNQDVTKQCTIVADPAIDTVPVVIRPRSPFKEGSWHLFQAVYPDGTTARVSIGAWQPGLVYGMWGYSQVSKNDDENRKFFLEDMRVHNITTLMDSIPGEVRAFLRTKEGQEYSRKTGIRPMTNWVGDAVSPPFLFLTDEPDAHDFMIKRLDPHKRLGSLAQWLVERANLFRRQEPSTPVLLNIDNTFKPENWYTYAQLADLPCADPYYQESVQSVWASDPTNLGAYLKPTYVYGVGTIYQSAGAPKPMHLILHTCQMKLKNFPYRGPTPEEKRIEAYYALAAGAKALSYWWYTPFGEWYGCGGNTKEMKSLWKEIGLLGAEVRTAEPMIIRSCPAGVPTRGPRMLWVRSLLAGPETAIILVVNDNMASDRLGTVLKPVEKATLAVQLPSWLKATASFEVTCEGTRDLPWQAVEKGVTFDLGTVHVTRLLVVTEDVGLRDRLQGIYEERFAANVRELLARNRAQTEK